jgi:hypothetical protein
MRSTALHSIFTDEGIAVGYNFLRKVIKELCGCEFESDHQVLVLSIMMPPLYPMAHTAYHLSPSVVIPHLLS